MRIELRKVTSFVIQYNKIVVVKWHTEWYSATGRPPGILANALRRNIETPYKYN